MQAKNPTKRIFGLIGYPLEHSFSPNYFRRKFENEQIPDAEYTSFPLTSIEAFEHLPLDRISGLNVTIPYKEAVIPYLDDLDEGARAVGAVNTVAFRGPKRIGYNTDVAGFDQSLDRFMGDEATGVLSLILGNGGASKAVQYVLAQRRMPFSVLSRRDPQWNYDGLTAAVLSKYKLIINTTPLGMFPETHSCPAIPYDGIGPGHFLFDLVYNPEKTVFLKYGEQRGARIKNGLEMLRLQAEKAWEIWTKE